MLLMQLNRWSSLLQEGDQFANVKLSMMPLGPAAGARDVSSTATFTMFDEHVSDQVTFSHEFLTQVVRIASTTLARASANFPAFAPLAKAEESQHSAMFVLLSTPLGIHNCVESATSSSSPPSPAVPGTASTAHAPSRLPSRPHALSRAQTERLLGPGRWRAERC